MSYALHQPHALFQTHFDVDSYILIQIRMKTYLSQREQAFLHVALRSFLTCRATSLHLLCFPDSIWRFKKKKLKSRADQSTPLGSLWKGQLISMALQQQQSFQPLVIQVAASLVMQTCVSWHLGPDPCMNYVEGRKRWRSRRMLLLLLRGTQELGIRLQWGLWRGTKAAPLGAARHEAYSSLDGSHSAICLEPLRPMIEPCENAI